MIWFIAIGVLVLVSAAVLFLVWAAGVSAQGDG